MSRKRNRHRSLSSSSQHSERPLLHSSKHALGRTTVSIEHPE
jgi:hypothetical protein